MASTGHEQPGLDLALEYCGSTFSKNLYSGVAPLAPGVFTRAGDAVFHLPGRGDDHERTEAISVLRDSHHSRRLRSALYWGSSSAERGVEERPFLLRSSAVFPGRVCCTRRELAGSS